MQYDILVIGAGIAGASVAARLAMAGKHVALLEMENHPGYHTTGRSAAVYAPSYGPAPIRALTRASQGFFQSPPSGFTANRLLTPRLIMMIARPDQQDALHDLYNRQGRSGEVSMVDQAAMRLINPLVRDGYAALAMLDTAGQDIDVGSLHQGFLAQFKSAGGTLVSSTEVNALHYSTQAWVVRAGNEQNPRTFHAQMVVNAAGAWADHINTMAGTKTISLVPKRRTVAMVAAPDGASRYPITIDIDEQFYLKPDSGRLLISPADETPCNACDAQPEDMDIAVCVDRIETAFDLQVKQIEHKWAGLRSFVADKSPVAGFSIDTLPFYYLAGQGGYGIQTSPALSDFAASQILDRQIPSYIIDQGLDPADLSPLRL